MPNPINPRSIHIPGAATGADADAARVDRAPAARVPHPDGVPEITFKSKQDSEKPPELSMPPVQAEAAAARVARRKSEFAALALPILRRIEPHDGEKLAAKFAEDFEKGMNALDLTPHGRATQERFVRAMRDPAFRKLVQEECAQSGFDDYAVCWLDSGSRVRKLGKLGEWAGVGLKKWPKAPVLAPLGAIDKHVRQLTRHVERVLGVEQDAAKKVAHALISGCGNLETLCYIDLRPCFHVLLERLEEGEAHRRLLDLTTNEKVLRKLWLHGSIAAKDSSWGSVRVLWPTGGRRVSAPPQEGKGARALHVEGPEFEDALRPESKLALLPVAARDDSKLQRPEQHKFMDAAAKLIHETMVTQLRVPSHGWARDNAALAARELASCFRKGGSPPVVVLDLGGLSGVTGQVIERTLKTNSAFFPLIERWARQLGTPDCLVRWFSTDDYADFAAMFPPRWPCGGKATAFEPTAQETQELRRRLAVIFPKMESGVIDALALCLATSCLHTVKNEEDSPLPQAYLDVQPLQEWLGRKFPARAQTILTGLDSRGAELFEGPWSRRFTPVRVVVPLSGARPAWLAIKPAA